MIACRFAVATAVLVMLYGPASAGTMDMTKDDPPAVPVAGQSATGENAGNPSGPGCRADASGCVPAGTASGPEAVVPAADDIGSIGAETAPGDAADYWTPERMRKAKPLPTPQLPADAFDTLTGADKKNR